VTVRAVRHRPKAPRAQVLYFPGCPNYEHARELVEQAAEELGLDADIELLEVEDADATVAMRFLGSPTVRVDGHDVEPRADERVDFAFACRLYRNEERVLEVPDASWIREALAAAARR
jgi:hypothetical protein